MNWLSDTYKAAATAVGLAPEPEPETAEFGEAEPRVSAAIGDVEEDAQEEGIRIPLGDRPRPVVCWPVTAAAAVSLAVVARPRRSLGEENDFTNSGRE